MSERQFKHDPALAGAIERQLRDWSLARKQRAPLPAAARVVHDFITISRAVGCEGDAVARLVAEKLGWPIFDRQILQTMAGNDAMREEVYRSLDGRDMTWIEEATTAFLHPDFIRNDYFRKLVEATLALARGSNAIFIGRGVDLILPRERGLRVRIAANPDTCVANFAAANHLDPTHARKEVERLERERADFIRHHFRVEAANLARFDLGINLDHLTPAHAAELIVAAHQLRARNP